MLHCLRISLRRSPRSKNHPCLPGWQCGVNWEELKKKVRDRIEEANESTRAVGPALANKKEQKWGRSLLDWDTENAHIYFCGILQKTCVFQMLQLQEGVYFCQPGSLSDWVKQSPLLTCTGTCSMSKKHVFIVLSHWDLGTFVAAG